MIRALWMQAFAFMTMLCPPSLATADETAAYINALATYAESKVIDDAGLNRIVEGCSSSQIVNPFTRETASTSTDKLLAFETLQDYIDNAELDADRVRVWAKRAQVDRQRQKNEREETREETIKIFEEPEDTVLSAGRSFTCAIASNKTVLCWGAEDYVSVPKDLGEVRSVSAGGDQICAIKLDGNAKCWGNPRGGHVNPLDKVRSISVGDYHTCGVKVDGNVLCFGLDYDGQTTAPIDLGLVHSVFVGDQITCAKKVDGTIHCWGYYGRALTDILQPLCAIRSGSFGLTHKCVHKADGTAHCYCWYWNKTGNIDIPFDFDLGEVRAISAGDYHICAVKVNNSTQCWGNDGYGQTTIPTELGVVRSVTSGGKHTCAAKMDGTVQCWGNNEHGQADVPVGLCLLGFDCGGAKP